jgi:hypothetical protein
MLELLSLIGDSLNLLALLVSKRVFFLLLVHIT